MNRLSSYVSKAPEFQKLPKGQNEVRLVSYKETDSFRNYDGTEKSTLPDYDNPTEQLVITVVSTTGKGGLTHRLNMDGFVKYKELTPEEIASKLYTDIDGYACAMNKKTKKLERVSDEKRCATCEGILDQFFASLQIGIGSGLEALDEAIAEKRAFNVDVTVEEYDGKQQYRIGSFKKAIAPASADSGMEA